MTDANNLKEKKHVHNLKLNYLLLVPVLVCIPQYLFVLIVIYLVVMSVCNVLNKVHVGLVNMSVCLSECC